MKRKNITIIVLLLLIFSMSFSLLACKKDKFIVEIDSKKLTLDDFLYDIYLIGLERDIWNDEYKEILGVDYWEYEFDGMTMEQLAKDTIMTSVILYEILSDQAKKEGYGLNKDELVAIETDVDKLIASMSEDKLKETGMNRKVLIDAFNKLAQADRYYLAIIGGYEVDKDSIQSTIDPEEYREYKTECLYVPTAEFKDQNITPFKEDDLEKANDRISEIKELIMKGSDFDEILGKVDGATRYERSFILADNTAEEEYKLSAKELNKDEYSDVITTKFGHYIIHMLDNSSSERYEKAIQDAVQNEKAAQFRTHYDALLQDYKININSEYWDSLDLDSIISD